MRKFTIYLDDEVARRLGELCGKNRIRSALINWVLRNFLEVNGCSMKLDELYKLVKPYLNKKD